MIASQTSLKPVAQRYFKARLGKVPSPGGEGQGEGGLSTSNSAQNKGGPSRRAPHRPSVARARSLRKKSSWAEKLVWQWLRSRKFNGYKFRRQFPIGEYIVDFYCDEAHLSIELDGYQHGHPARQAIDAERSKFLETRGIKELRFWNSRLRREQDVIRNAIFEELQHRAPHPLPAYTRLGIAGDQHES